MIADTCLGEFESELRALPEVRAVRRFESDANVVMIDVHTAVSAYVIEFQPRLNRYFFDEMDWSGGMDTAYRHQFDNLELLRRHVLSVIRKSETVSAS